MKKICAIILAAALILCGCEKSAVPSYYAEKWEAGYGECEIPLDTENTDKYFVAGYKNGFRATGVLDVPKVRAMWLGAGNEALLMLSADCVALASGDVEIIKSRLSGIVSATGCRILVFATHTHAGVDTLGLWGDVAVNGKDSEYMEALYESCRKAGESAYSGRKTGKLLYSTTDRGIENLQEDSRKPENYDKLLHQLHFVPENGGSGIRLINYAAHAESLRGDNSKISADYPGYTAREIKENTGDDTLFIQGAIGGLIMTRYLSGENGQELSPEENCKETGKLIAEAALSAENERELTPYIYYGREDVTLPLDNDVLVAMKSLGIINNDVKNTVGGRHGLAVKTHVCRLTLGDVETVTVPGEIFPEVIYSGGKSKKNFMVWGLCDDEIGYIIPEKNFMLNEKHPYLDTAPDYTGENHYEETNSLGKDTARLITDTIAKLYGK